MNYFKSLFKKVFPLIFLRKIQLFFNIILNKAFYSKIFPIFKEDKAYYLTYRALNPFLTLIKPAEVPAPLKPAFKIWLNEAWNYDEYIFRFPKSVIIDPLTGWGIVESERALLYPSLGYSNEPHVKKPSVTKFFRENKFIDFTKIISFRDTAEENYFHFFNDILSKFFFLKRNNLIDRTIPLIIGEKLYKTAYFRYFLEHTSLGRYNWHVQKPDIYIRTGEALFCKPITHRLDIYNDIIDELKINPDNLTKSKKIFLQRPPSSLRFIENRDEILSVLKEQGYEGLEAETMSFKDQIDLFSQTSHLFSVHGAGLSNMMFRRGGQLTVTEIFTPYRNFLPFHYIMMTKMFGFNYRFLIGERIWNQFNGGFYVNPQSINNTTEQ